MRKHISKLLLAMMVLAMAFCIAACGSEKNDSKTNNSQGTVSNEGSQSESKDQSVADDTSDQGEKEKKYASVADYVSSDEVQYVLDMFETQLAGSGMSMDILAEGDKLVYSYKMEGIEKANLTDEEIANLGSSVEAESATFQETADQVKKLVDAEAPSLVIRYLDANGEEIYSKEFPAQ